MLDATDIDSTAYARAREAATTKPVDDVGNRDAATGRFRSGNRAWAVRASSGPAPKFTDADALWKACVAYFEWVEANPLIEMQLVTYQGRATQVPLRKMRAMTKGDLCRHLNIARTTWNAWHDRPDLAAAVERAESVIWCWQFGGAAAGLLDVNLVIRQLGIGRKTEQARTP
jgi:hypothetical protein